MKKDLDTKIDRRLSGIIKKTWCTCNRKDVIPTRKTSGHRNDCPVHIAWVRTLYPHTDPNISFGYGV